MSVTADEPVAYGSSAREFDEVATETQGGDVPSLVAQAFEGWDLMTDVVAETDPALADVMSSGGLLARAAFAEQIPRLLDDVSAKLTDGGLADSAREDLLGELKRRLRDPQCPFTSGWLADQHQQAIQDLKDGQPGDPDLIQHLWRRVSTVLGSAFESEAAEARKAAEPPARRKAGEWRIIATVERPVKIGQPGSLLCTHRPTRRIRLEETTYQNILHSGRAESIKLDQYVALTDEGRNFDDHEPTEFLLGLDNPPEWVKALGIDEFIDSAVYFVQLDANRRRHKLVLTFLDQHEEAIRDALQAAVKRAVNVFDSGMLVPGRVLAALSDVVVKIVRTILERGIAATTFPGWFIQHTIIQVGDDPPRSAVLLHSLEDPNVTLVGAQMVAGTMRAVRDYSHFDVPQLWPRGRILLGHTLPAGAAADLEMVPPPELWKWVDAYQHPVVWSDAMENGQPPTRGFRVLLPFAPLPSRRTGKRPNGPHYVAALRVEVYFHAGFVL